MILKTLYKSFWTSIRPLIYVMFFCLIGYFFGLNIYTHFQEIKNHSFEINIFILIASFLGYFLFYFLLTILWKSILGKPNIPFKDILRVNTISWLSKYIPGKVSIILSKVIPLEKFSVSKKESFLSVVYEQIFQIISALLLSLPFILFLIGNDQQNSYIYGALVWLFVCILMIQPKIFHFWLNTALKLTKRDIIKQEQFLGWKKILYYIFWYMCVVIVKWLSFALFAYSLWGITPSMIPYLSFTWIFAWVVSIIAFFAPNGIWFREGIMMILLSYIVTPEIALILSISSRLWSWVADGLIGLILLKK